MFNTGKPEINYIGKLTIFVQPTGGKPYYFSDIYPISGLKDISDKTVIQNFLNNEYQKFAPTTNDGYVKSFKVSSKFNDKEEGPDKYTLLIVNSSGNEKRGTISFEIFDEAKLFEKRDFI